MELLFLHGAPASGKFTVAKSILQKKAGKLFDNHAAIDFAKTIFDFGAPGFWPLVKKVRVEAIKAAADFNLEFLIYTSCYSDPDDLEFYEAIEQVVLSAGGKILPAFLRCPVTVLKDRAKNVDRIQRRKIHSSEGVEKFLSEWNISPVPRSECFQVDSSRSSADETADKIINNFKI